MSKNTKKGFLSLEAAIFVPVFVIAVLTFGYLSKVAVAEENLMHSMADEARKIGMYSYNIKAGPLHEGGLAARLAEENKGACDAYPESFRYLFHYSGKDDLIGIRVSGSIKIRLPIIFHDSVDISEVLLSRAFTGKEFTAEDARFDDMEKAEDSKIVWVFPVAGEKYHEENCGYINVAARQAVLSPALKKKYKPCSLCGAGDAAMGSLVYYFESSGSVYHKGSCYMVDRYVISMEESDAIKKGYSPCSKCM